MIGRREADVRLRSELDPQFAMQLAGKWKVEREGELQAKKGHWAAVHVAFGAGFDVFAGRDIKLVGKSVY
jgi:hypothetical protein